MPRILVTLLTTWLAACGGPEHGGSDAGRTDGRAADAGHDATTAPSALAPLVTWSLPADPDIGRDLLIDGSTLVVVGTDSKYAGTGQRMLDAATIGRYDASTGAVVTPMVRFGTVDAPMAVTRTWFLDVAQGNGSYFATGKSDASDALADLCPHDPYPLPRDSNNTVAQVVKYGANLTMQDCTALPLLKNGNLKSTEISGVDTGDGQVWIGGSGTGGAFAGAADPRKVVAHIAPVPSGDPLTDTDLYVARLSPDLDTIHLTMIGSDQWDEVLAIDYDPDHDIVYVAGSTKGDLCAAYPGQAAAGCRASSQNRAGNGAADNRFDAYLMAVRWDPGGNRFVLLSVLQRGRDGEDTRNAVVLFRHGPEVTVPGLDLGDYLYAGGKFDSDPADGVVVIDRIIDRVRVDPGAAASRDVLAGSTLVTYTDAAAEPDYSEHVQGLAVTATHVYASGARHVTSAASHAGPCAGGTASAGIAMIEAFPHPPTGGGFVPSARHDAPPPDPGDPPGHDATDGKSIVTDGTNLYFIAQTTLPPTAHCGPDAELDHDDDLDMVVYTHPL